jgi:KUP system potassium uptake protein
VSGFFLLFDVAFFSANLLKIREGGWAPLLLGALIFIIMTTWHRGIVALGRSMTQRPETLENFIGQLESGRIVRVPGTAVFLSRSEIAIPPVMVRHVAQIRALQEQLVSLTVRFEEYPRVALDQRAEVEQITKDFWHVTVRFGFVERPDLSSALTSAKEKGCLIDLHDAVYFAARDEVVRRPGPPRLTPWRRMLFAFLYRNAVRTPDRFDLPADRFLEVGRQIEL